MTMACAATAHEAAPTSLPLGDHKLSAVPTRGYVMACITQFPGGGGAQRAGEWIKGGFWSPELKIVVDGDVRWPNAFIAISLEGPARIVRANNLPQHGTGEFPIRRGTRAYEYDRNPNSIREQTVWLRLPAHPTIANAPGCVPMGMVGFALSGAAIFNAFDLLGRDAPAYEIQDSCAGHPERNGRYHYHNWSPCIPDAAGSAQRHSDLAGFMLDGFPIFGPRGDGGAELHTSDLDECHGHTHEVNLDGSRAITYHYHFTREYPYTIGCFRGTVSSGPSRRPPPPSSR